MTKKQREERECIDECLLGNRDAFEFLVKQYEKNLFYTSLRMIGNQEDARDIVQETFLKAYKALETYNPEYAFSTWLYRILINLCINFLEKKQRFFMDISEDIEDSIPQMSGPEKEEFWDNVENALNEVPLAERCAFILATFEMLPVSEIAQVLQIPKGTVCWRLFQARKKLRFLLQNYNNTMEKIR